MAKKVSFQAWISQSQMAVILFSTEIQVQSDDLRSNSKVLVVEAAQYRDGDDLIAGVLTSHLRHPYFS